MSLKRTSRIVLFWVIPSLIIQVFLYSYLDYKLSKILSPNETDLYLTNEIIIPGTEISNPKLSSSRRLLAYFNKQSLEVYDLSSKSVVFRSPSINGRVIGYSWLPDRDNLIYFYSNVSDSNHSLTYSSKETYLSTLEFVKDKNIPIERHSNVMYSFSANGLINDIAISTFTNLIYVLFNHTDYSSLIEIDINKNSKTISRSGEIISNITISDKSGILYIESSIPPKPKRILSVNGWKRSVFEDSPQSMIIGYQSGQLYVGIINENYLEEIKVVEESYKNIYDREHVIWKGHLPLSHDIQTAIISKGKVAILSSNSLYIIEDGQIYKRNFSGSQTYIAKNSKMIIQLTRDLDFTKLNFFPLI